MKILIRTGKEIMVDDEDLERVLKVETDFKKKWTVSRTLKNRVVIVIGNNTTEQLSRFIMMYSGPLDVDHIDRNCLNNQKSNLRVVTNSVNQLNKSIQSNNKSGFKGVILNKAMQKWQAYIRIDKKLHHLGFFFSKEEAVQARKLAEAKFDVIC